MEFHNGSKYQNYKSFSKKLVAKAEELLFEVQLLLVYLPKPSCLVELFPGSLTGDECAVLRIWRPLYTLEVRILHKVGPYGISAALSPHLRRVPNPASLGSILSKMPAG